MATRSQLKQYFLTGKKPTQGQFAELIDAFFSKAEDQITIADIQGLANLLAGKASTADIVALNDAITTVSNKVGDLAQLSTEDKTNLVAAINELLQSGLTAANLGRGLIIDANSLLTLDLESKELADVWITIQTGGVPVSYDNTDPFHTKCTVMKGTTVPLTLTYYYSVNEEAGYAAPTGVSGSWGDTLPESGVDSEPLIESVTTDTTYTVTLYKPKTGLIVQGEQVVFATGNDTKTNRVSLLFRNRGYFGHSLYEELTANRITNIGNGVYQSARARTVTGVTTPAGQYTYYCYPAEFGPLIRVVMDGATQVLGAFRRLADVAVINEKGYTENYIVYRSNAIQAFNNNSLAFS